MPKQLSNGRRGDLSPDRPGAVPWLGRSRLVALLLLVLMGGGLLLIGVGRSGRRHWGEGVNVILISLDTTRQDRLSCYGYAHNTTPAIDALSDDALVFRRAAAVSNWTLPTHASMLTGLYPSSHGAHLLQDAKTRLRHAAADIEPSGALHASCQTLGEVLQSHGYRTAAIVANSVYLQKAYRLDQGFDWYDDRCTCAQCAPNAGDARVPYRDAREITDEAVRWLDKKRKRSFFLFLNYNDPHLPYFPPPPFDKRFRGAGAERVERQLPRPRPWMMHLSVFRALQATLPPHASAAHDDVLDWLSSQHDGELAFVDAQVGRLVQWLRDQGIYDRTLIVLTSDHGECFGEHGLLDHGNSFYEPELAVPMIVKLPRQERRGWNEKAVHHVDVMPTVLHALGLPVPSSVHGSSMLSEGDRDLFAEKHVLSADHATHRYAVYRGHLKYIEDIQGNAELYDLQTDPHELNNLAQRRTDDVAALRDALEDWKERVVPIDSASPSRLRPENEQLLRDFGYLQ